MELHQSVDQTISARDRLSRQGRQPLSRRLRVRAFPAGLDQALAAGAAPLDDPSLMLRAEHLRSAQSRRQLAGSLIDILARAEHPRPLSSAAPVARRSVLANRALIERVAERLESEPTPGVDGIATVNLLLTEGTSPLWIYSDGRELRDALEAAMIRLSL